MFQVRWTGSLMVHVNEVFAAPPVCRAEEQLRSMSNTGAFNILHLRAEDEWLLHCTNWESIGDGMFKRVFFVL